MKKRLFNAAALWLSMALQTTALADTADQVNRWFSNMNYASVTKPGVYEGQAARYATFGGISTRASITQPFKFVNIQTPKFSAGCGGIDFYAGGFSAIDADPFIDNLRAIGQNAQSLAFLLAIQIVSPQLSGVMQHIQTWAQHYLNMNLDSCEAATQMVGGALDFFGAKQGNCTIKRMQDFGEDWSTANYACTTGAKIKSTEMAGGDANTIDFVKGNLTWYVLMQDDFFKADTQFAEVILNIIGTVIISDAGTADDAPSAVTAIRPAIDGDIQSERFQNIYTALLMGKKAASKLQIYRCTDGAVADPNTCTTLSNSPETITPSWTGLHDKVERLVSSIIDSIYIDKTPLTAEQRGFISSTSIPLYRYLVATAAYFPRGTNVSRYTDNYTALMAQDILLRALNAVIANVDQRSGMLKDGLSDSVRIKAFRDELKGVLHGFARMQKENDFDAEQLFRMQQRIQLYEKALMSRLGSGFIANAMWGQ